jgi:hypothetical protein
MEPDGPPPPIKQPPMKFTTFKRVSTPKILDELTNQNYADCVKRIENLEREIKLLKLLSKK